jgi:chromosome segregation ATPase
VLCAVCCWQIKELAARKEKLSAISEQLQESRDRTAAALAKLREQYETMAADNTQLRSANAELKALIDGLKARLNLSA